MSLRPAETRERLRRACEYPADVATLVERVGETELRTPTGSTVRLERVLERCDASRFRSADSAHQTLMATLDDRHVGRKYYDDRGPNPVREDHLAL